VVADDDGSTGDLIKSQRINTKRRTSVVAQGKIKHFENINETGPFTVSLTGEWVERSAARSG
jgi:hypothetical protein